MGNGATKRLQTVAQVLLSKPVQAILLGLYVVNASSGSDGLYEHLSKAKRKARTRQCPMLGPNCQLRHQITAPPNDLLMLTVV